MNHLVFEPLIPASMWLLLVVVSAAALGWYARRRPGRLSMRRWSGIVALTAAGLAIVLMVLLNPTWLNVVLPPGGKPAMTVLVDDSASMRVKDVKGGARYAAARSSAVRIAQELSDRYDVALLAFSSQVGPLVDDADHVPAGAVTDLAGAISKSMLRDCPAGQSIVLLSDGIHHAASGVQDVLTAARAARLAGVPVFACSIGRAEPPVGFDLELQAQPARQIAFVGQTVPIHLRLAHPGVPGGSAVVTLRRDETQVETKTVELPVSEPASIRFEVKADSPGVYRYELSVANLPGELSEVNNRTVAMVQVIDEPVRMLLLEGKPYWDSKFLTRTLSLDPVIALDSVVRMSADRFVRRSARRPSVVHPASQPGPASRPALEQEDWTVVNQPTEWLCSAGTLDSYQAVVLGREADAFLDDRVLASLSRWMIHSGGSLLCYRGAPASQIRSALARMLPVQWNKATETHFHLHLTGEAAHCDWLGVLDQRLSSEIWARLPLLASAEQAQPANSAATVLATALSADGRTNWPIVTSQLYGTGRVVVIEGAGMWRWAFQPAGDRHDGEVYAVFWRNLVQWLIGGMALRPGQQVDLRPDKVCFEASEPISATLLTRLDPTRVRQLAVRLQRKGDPAMRTVAPVAEPGSTRLARVHFGELEPGCYRAEVVVANEALAATLFDVQPPTREYVDLAARPDLMTRIARDSGGAVLQTAGPAELSRAVEEVRQRTHPVQVRRSSAWDTWWVLVGILAVWTANWATRRSAGLI